MKSRIRRIVVIYSSSTLRSLWRILLRKYERYRYSRYFSYSANNNKNISARYSYRYSRKFRSWRYRIDFVRYQSINLLWSDSFFKKIWSSSAEFFDGDTRSEISYFGKIEIFELYNDHIKRFVWFRYEFIITISKTRSNIFDSSRLTYENRHLMIYQIFDLVYIFL